MSKTIECRADLCGREAYLEGEDWYFCKCGWSGNSYDEVASLKEEIIKLQARLNDALDLLENCGYCRECMWDRESIGGIVDNLKEPIWPDNCTPLCMGCMLEFKEMFE
jgi:hypothetical protein